MLARGLAMGFRFVQLPLPADPEYATCLLSQMATALATRGTRSVWQSFVHNGQPQCLVT